MASISKIKSLSLRNQTEIFQNSINEFVVQYEQGNVNVLMLNQLFDNLHCMLIYLESNNSILKAVFEQLFINTLQLILLLKKKLHDPSDGRFHELTKIFCSLCDVVNIRYDFVDKWLTEWIKFSEDTSDKTKFEAFSKNVKGFRKFAKLLTHVGCYSHQSKMIKILLGYSNYSSKGNIDEIITILNEVVKDETIARSYLIASTEANQSRTFLNIFNRADGLIKSFYVNSMLINGKPTKLNSMVKGWMDLNFGPKNAQIWFVKESKQMQVRITNDNINKIIPVCLSDVNVQIEFCLIGKLSIENQSENTIYNVDIIKSIKLNLSIEIAYNHLVNLIKEMFPGKLESEVDGSIETNADDTKMGNGMLVIPVFESATQTVEKSTFDISYIGANPQTPPSSTEYKSEKILVCADIHQSVKRCKKVLNSSNIIFKTLSQSVSPLNVVSPSVNYDEILEIRDDVGLLPRVLTSLNYHLFTKEPPTFYIPDKKMCNNEQPENAVVKTENIGNKYNTGDESRVETEYIEGFENTEKKFPYERKRKHDESIETLKRSGPKTKRPHVSLLNDWYENDKNNGECKDDNFPFPVLLKPIRTYARKHKLVNRVE